MLTEHFVASIAAPQKTPTASSTKDVGIFVHELQPLAGQRSVFKKSVTAPNCLAVSEGHIFAAQANKAVIHVYSREKGNQEAIIPFPERITAITLAAEDTVLVLGTVSGQIFLWEICTGRLIPTPQSHLQTITCLAVDPTSNFLLSGSSDSNVHVWSLSNLLSFAQSSPSSDTDPRQPIYTLSKHRGEITAIACGASSGATNIAVTAGGNLSAKGGALSSAIVWDYRTGTALRTYLLDDVPRALALDILGRGFFTTYDDGSVQMVDFYVSGQRKTLKNISDEADANTALQPGSETRWRPNGQLSEAQALGAGNCLLISWDGSQLLSGHETGKIVSWDVGTGTCRDIAIPLPGPVTNLLSLPVQIPNREKRRQFKISTVVKPRIGVSDSTVDSGFVPFGYSFISQPTTQVMTDTLHNPLFSLHHSSFDDALTHHSFPQALLEEGLSELAFFGQAPHAADTTESASKAAAEEYMKLDDDIPERPSFSSDERIEQLQKQVRQLQAVQKLSFKRMDFLRSERLALSEELDRRNAKTTYRPAAAANGINRHTNTNGKPKHGDQRLERTAGNKAKIDPKADGHNDEGNSEEDVDSGENHSSEDESDDDNGNELVEGDARMDDASDVGEDSGSIDSSDKG